MFGLDSWLRQTPDGVMTGGRTLERGAGAYTLCYGCNTEISGDHYVGELKRWTAIGMAVMSQQWKSGQEGNAVELTLNRVYPARILKQIVVMLASINSSELLEHHDGLREYAMNPHTTGLPARYQFYLLVTHPGSKVSRFAGLSMRLSSGTWCATAVTDLVWPPFGYVMTIDEPRALGSSSSGLLESEQERQAEVLSGADDGRPRGLRALGGAHRNEPSRSLSGNDLCAGSIDDARREY